MQALKVMIIRHAEKPADREGKTPPFGVDEDGRPDPRSLSPLGWQRAGALTAWFSTPRAAAIERPATLLSPLDRNTSQRSRQTLAPLGRRLGLPVRTDHPVGAEEALAADILACTGSVLVAWEHRALPRIPALLAGSAVRAPSAWPSARFDLVWIVERDAGGAWRFAQTPQCLLAGDSDTVVAIG